MYENKNHEPRNITVSSKVTESLKQKMQHLFLVDSSDTESNQIYRALQLMYSNRGLSSSLNSEVRKAGQFGSKLGLDLLDKRIKVDSSTHEIADFGVAVALKICEISEKVLRNEYIEDLAVIVYEVKSYSEQEYDIAVKRVCKIMNKGNRTVFTDMLKKQSEVNKPHTIIGGTLDTYENDISELVNNCMTVPKDKREGKIDDTLHYITQNKENSNELCEAFLNELERAEHVKN